MSDIDAAPVLRALLLKDADWLNDSYPGPSGYNRIADHILDGINELDDLRAVNAELLAALKTVTGLLEHMIHDEFDGTSLLAETLEPVIAARAVISKFDDAPSVSSVPDVFPRASGRSAVASPGGGGVGGVSVTSADVPKPAPEHSMWNGARL